MARKRKVVEPEPPPPGPTLVSKLWTLLSGVVAKFGASLLWVSVPVLVLWTAMRFTPINTYFPFAQFVSFTPYVAVVAVILALIAVALRHWAVVIVMVAVVSIFALALGPRAASGPETNAGAHPLTLKVMTANLEYGQGDPVTLVKTAKSNQADVLGVQEFTDQAQLGLNKAGIDSHFPYHVLFPSSGSSGIALYSRYPLRNSHKIDTMPQGAISTVVSIDGHSVEVVTVHTVSPIPSQMKQWRADFRRLPSAPNPPQLPRVIFGDFNATLDHSVLQDLIDTGYIDTAAALGKGLTSTWRGNMVPALTIDHVLVSAGISPKTYQVIDLPQSDHRIVFAELKVSSATR